MKVSAVNLILFLVLIFNGLSFTNAQPNLPAPNPTLNYLALGDSYTIGTAIGQTNSFASLLAKKLDSLPHGNKVELQIIAQNGWTTADLLAGLKEAKPSANQNLVTLLIGVNNQYQKKPLAQYQEEFTQLLAQAITLAQGQPKNVIVLSIPDWGSTPAGENNRTTISQEIDAFNAANKAISQAHGVNYLNVTAISRKASQNPKLVAGDNLHFSKAMHQLWLAQLYPQVARILALK